MPAWSLPSFISLLKGCEPQPMDARNNNTVIVQKYTTGVMSLRNSSFSLELISSSPESHNISSGEVQSAEQHPYSCLYDDIIHLSIPMVEQIITNMMSYNVDHKFLSKCLLHYLQSAKKNSTNSDNGNLKTDKSGVMMLETIELVVDLLYRLEWDSISCKSLFSVLRLASSLSAAKPCLKKVEEMIGSQLDMATLDNILICRNQQKAGTLYDVNLILRLVKIFLADQGSVTKCGALKKVANLLDKYLAEIAPDPGLTPGKFKVVAMVLPANARDSHDDLYRALDIYLETHSRTHPDHITDICKIIDFQKLPLELRKHAAQSMRFPASITLKVLLDQQPSLKATMDNHHHHSHQQTSDKVITPRSAARNIQSIAQSHGKCTTLSKDLIHTIKFNNASLQCFNRFAGPRRSLYEQMTLEKLQEKELGYQIVLQQNEELRTELQQMQSRVLELEKAYGKMRIHATKFARNRLLC